MDVPRHSQFYSPENWKVYNAFLKNLADVFREGQEQGIYCQGISPLIASYIIYGAVDMTIRQYVYNPEFNHEDFPIEQAKEQIVQMLKQGFSRGRLEWVRTFTSGTTGTFGSYCTNNWGLSGSWSWTPTGILPGRIST